MAKKHTIQISVQDEVVESLASRFPDLEDKAKLVSAVALLALTEWEEWFAGRLRPRSLSVLALERIKKIYSHMDLYAGRQVSRGVLFNRFNLPYGEAAYLERVFAELDQPSLKKRKLEEIRRALAEQLNEWRKDKNKRENQSFVIEVNKHGQQLLQSLLHAMKQDGLGIAPTENALAVRGYYNYTFSADEAESLVARVGEELRNAAR